MNRAQQHAVVEQRRAGWLVAHVFHRGGREAGTCSVKLLRYSSVRDYTERHCEIDRDGAIGQSASFDYSVKTPPNSYWRERQHYHPGAPTPDPIAIRQTPAGEPTIADLFKPGDLIEYCCCTTPTLGKIISIHPVLLQFPDRDFRRWDYKRGWKLHPVTLKQSICWTFEYSDPQRDGAVGYLDEMVMIDGKVVTLFESDQSVPWFKLVKSGPAIAVQLSFVSPL